MTVQQLINNLSQIKDKSIELLTDDECINIMIHFINNIAKDRDYYRDKYFNFPKE